MKTLIKFLLILFIGCLFVGGSTYINGHNSFGFGFWSVWLGVSIITGGLTWHHGLMESKRRIKRKRKIIRVLYRSFYFCLISLAIYRGFNFDFLLLSVNQAFLFGVLFDPIRNHYAGDHFFYHGAESYYDDFAKKNPVILFLSEIALFLVTSYYIVF